MDKSLPVFGMGKDQAKANLSLLDDPWEQPPYFLLRKNKDCKSLRTHSGHWEEKKEELTAIRSAGESSASSSASPSYVGVRRTLEFYLNDGTNGGKGTRTDWITHEYHHLRKDDDGEALILQEDMVLRKVFKKCENKTDQASSLYHQVESCVQAFKELKQVLSSRRGDNGNKTDIFGTEGLGLSIAHRRPQYKEGSSSDNDKEEVQLQTFQTKEVQVHPNISNYIKNREKQLRRLLPFIDTPTKFLGYTEAITKLAKELKILTADLQTELALYKEIRALNENLGVQKEDLGQNEELRVLNEDLGVQNEDLGVLDDDFGVENEDSGDLGVQNEDFGADCDQHGQSVEVWKHFTKIRRSNDPDEVYAVCHRCDKVFRAHPQKDGTSDLKCHILKCSSTSYTNRSTDEDREMLYRLRTVIDNEYEKQKMDEKLNCQEDLTQRDPCDLNLTHWYVTRSLNRQTQGGHWNEINEEFTAIRMDQKVCWKDIIDKEITVIQMVHQLQMQVPQYIGLRRTLQFHDQDGRKTDWMMLEYQQLDDMESPVLLPPGCMMIRKVFHYDKGVVAPAFSDMVRLLNADDGDEEYGNGVGVNTNTTTPSDYMDTPCSVFPLDEGMNTGTTTSSSDYMDTPVDRKRKRTAAGSGHKSQVWMHFTKIHSTDRGVVYVVCHTCDRGYGSGRSTNGTSHLWRHNKSCANKRRRTEHPNDATTEWEAEIWPLFVLFKNYGEHQASGMY